MYLYNNPHYKVQLQLAASFLLVMYMLIPIKIWLGGDALVHTYNSQTDHSIATVVLYHKDNMLY